jgi:hypothetical protein
MPARGPCHTKAFSAGECCRHHHRRTFLSLVKTSDNLARKNWLKHAR